MSGQFGRGGSRGGGMIKRGGPRGGGFSDRRGGRQGGRFDDSRSPDRRSVHSADDSHNARYGSYRQPQRQYSRSPVRRSPSPLPMRGYEGRSGRAEERQNSVDQVAKVAQAPAHRVESVNNVRSTKSEDDEAREWKIKMLDADEEVRRAEYMVRRAHMMRQNVGEAYEEFLKKSSKQASQKPNW